MRQLFEEKAEPELLNTATAVIKNIYLTMVYFVVDSNDDEFFTGSEDHKLIKPQANGQSATTALCGGTASPKCTVHCFLEAL